MQHFDGCLVVVGFDDGRPDQSDDDADLQLREGALLLSYWDDQGAVVLVGDEREPGCYELHARTRPRRCTLRREDARTFRGAWAQGNESGTLRVALRVEAGPVPGSGDQEER